MCFDLDSRPPIAPIAGGALDGTPLMLTAADRNRFAAFRARAAEPGGAAVAILPDVRGLHPYYEELALRFAERGIDALAIDWFGRTAGPEPRGDEFDYAPHVTQTTWAGISADITAAVEELSVPDGDRPAPAAVFTLGFCMGGRMSFLGGDARPRPGRRDGHVRHARRAVAQRRPGAGRRGSRDSRAPVLGLFGGADAGITPEAIASFDAALTAAGVDHRLETYPGAPHSFFDRKATEFADASAAAWDEVLRVHRGANAGRLGLARRELAAVRSGTRPARPRCVARRPGRDRAGRRRRRRRRRRPRCG